MFPCIPLLKCTYNMRFILHQANLFHIHVVVTKVQSYTYDMVQTTLSDNMISSKTAM